MDPKPSNPETDSWVDERLASLAPAPEWTPNTQRALNQILRGRKASGPKWLSMGMTATILATTVVVLALLPWQRLWTPDAAQKSDTASAVQPEKQKIAHEVAPAPATQAETAEGANVVVLERHLKASSENAEEAKSAQAEKLREIQKLDAKTKTEFEKVELAKRMQAEASAAGAAQSSGLTQPAIVSRVLPEYTEEVKQAKILGTVELIVTIRTDGSVQFERVKTSLGYGLDEKAREAVEKWQFTPGMKDGVPVPTMVGVNVTFSLR